MNASVVLYAPAFDFKVVPGAANYRFRLVVEESGKTVEFTADTPCRQLSPVWAKLPKTATINLTVDALDAGGEVVARSGERKIYKSAPFTGDYPKSKMKWREVAKKVFEYLLDCKEGKYFRANKAPEPNHKTNCYLSKQCSATIRSMISLADIAPERAKETLEFARINADYLIGESEGEKARLPYFPPTYTRTPMAGELKVAKMFRAQVMLDYPPAVGSAFLALYLKTCEKKYFDQADGIAETLLKSQLPCGTWPLKMDLATGEMVGTNLLVPGNVIGFLDGLFAATGDGRYREAADRACGYYDGLFKSWNWEGQVEDVNPTPKYQNLTMHNSLDILWMRLANENFACSDEDLKIGRDIVRFTEDQFVRWERTPAPKSAEEWKMYHAKNWKYPCALEQYACYLPIDASLAKMADGFLAMYTLEGRKLDWDKAAALCDSLARHFEEEGVMKTFLLKKNNPEGDWFNCMAYAAEVLLRMSAVKGGK